MTKDSIKPNYKQFQDLTGRKYGRLTVTSFVQRKSGVNFWLCLCSCGEEKIVRSSNLSTGHTNSCGCLLRECTSKSRLKHGHNRSSKLITPEYRAWTDMKSRCNNPKSNRYSTYGARGISVCKEWNYSFEAFISDMGIRPTNEHSLDRIDNNGNYEPSNCRWATRHEQCRNKTNNVLITHFDKTMTISDWSKHTGINPKTIRYRINNGWSMDKTLGTRSFT